MGFFLLENRGEKYGKILLLVFIFTEITEACFQCMGIFLKLAAHTLACIHTTAP